MLWAVPWRLRENFNLFPAILSNQPFISKKVSEIRENWKLSTNLINSGIWQPYLDAYYIRKFKRLYLLSCTEFHCQHLSSGQVLDTYMVVSLLYSQMKDISDGPINIKEEYPSYITQNIRGILTHLLFAKLVAVVSEFLASWIKSVQPSERRKPSLSGVYSTTIREEIKCYEENSYGAPSLSKTHYSI